MGIVRLPDVHEVDSISMLKKCPLVSLLRKCSTILCRVFIENMSFPRIVWSLSTQRAAIPPSVGKVWPSSHVRITAYKSRYCICSRSESGDPYYRSVSGFLYAWVCTVIFNSRRFLCQSWFILHVTWRHAYQPEIVAWIMVGCDLRSSGYVLLGFSIILFYLTAIL